MSLINQMLQDLDARRAAHGVGAGLPHDVRPLPKPQASRLPIIMGIVVLVALVAGFVLYQREIQQAVASLLPQAVPVATVLPPPVVPVPEPEKVVQPVPPPVEQPPLVAATLQDLDGSLRIADTLRLPAEDKPGAKPAKASAVMEKPVAVDRKSADEHGKAKVAEMPERPLPAMASVVPTAAGKSTRMPSIEKTDAVGSPRERAEAEYRKAISAVNQGRIEEAMGGLRNALRQDGLHVASRQLLVRLLLEAKRPDEAILVLQEGLQGQPAQIGWAISLARLQVDKGDLAGAWQTLDYSQPAAGNNADYLGFSAHVLQRLGRNKEAAEHYQAATRVAPNDGRWWLGLGLALDAEGRSSEAREAFLRARQGGNLSAELITLIEQKLR